VSLIQGAGYYLLARPIVKALYSAVNREKGKKVGGCTFKPYF